MLDQQPRPLAEQLAALSAELQAQAAPHTARPGPVAALHALFFAALLRLLASLITLVEAWQAGQLPPPIRRSRRADAPPRAARPRAAAANRTRPTPRHMPGPAAHAHTQTPNRARASMRARRSCAITPPRPHAGTPAHPSTPHAQGTAAHARPARKNGALRAAPIRA